MDKDRKNIYFIIGLIICISIIFISVITLKKKQHEEEISVLLSKQDISQRIKISDRDIQNTGQESNYSGCTKNEEIGLKDTTFNIAKKENKGVNFIEEVCNSKSNNIVDNSSSVNNIVVYRGKLVNYTDSDVDLLARIIYSEAGNQPYSGKLAVGNVVLYRTLENNTDIKSTIYAKNQFDAVNSSWFQKEPNEESKKAAIQILQDGATVLNNAYFYANLKLCNPSWAREDKFICRIGDHWFFRK